jgi:Protein of unknown function (DUF3435)
LIKKYNLDVQKCEKTSMFVKELLLILITTLRIIEKRFNLSRHRIKLYLFLQLAGFTVNRPSAILALQYKHIMMTTLRDPAGGSYRLLLEFTFEFIKEYLNMKKTYVLFFYFLLRFKQSTTKTLSELILTTA